MPSLQVTGMSCMHCVQAVQKAIEVLPGVASVHVDLATGQVSWTESQPVDLKAVGDAIRDIGFGIA